MLSSRVLPRLSAARCRPLLRRPRSAITAGHSSTRTFQTLASSGTSSSLGRSLSAAISTIDEDNNDPRLHQHRHTLQQVRWKRHSGASGDDPKPRRFSKKQKKRFRNERARERDLEKHSAPGSKAGKRREHITKMNQGMIDEYQGRLDGSYYAKKLEAHDPLQDPALEYTQEDALLDDMVGNAGHLTSQPTPEPVYYGGRQRQFYNRVVDQMEIYREELQALPPGRPAPKYLLPTDQEMAGALKAYRDQQGTRARPIGIAKALQHVLKEMGIPSTSIFGEYTFNALLSCCRTPKEGVRVFELMQQHKHEISAYSWAILVDINSKVGDFEGAMRALDEMHAEGHPPNMAAYTSFLAACYKVCNDGRIAHSIRAKAGKVGWEKWQELRINGLDPDAMCYGAMLRLCAARGFPEKAFNLLEEMPRFEVKPTTLCFTSALRAVAKSHETAIRYERGWSKKNKRRERIAAHHGKLARNMVMMAENAHVEIDDGFISALQLCSAAAGDSATAKAIYLAYSVRQNMKHWRQIGDEAHLARLRGEDPDSQMMIEGSPHSQALQIAGGGNGSSAVAQRHHQQRRPLTFAEREYGGNDTRTLSAILRACAQASDSNGVGTMWSGRENYGYLDLASLRLIQQYRQPKMRNTDIPGMSRLEVGMGALVSLEDMENPRKRNDPLLRRGARKNFPGVVTLDDAGKGLDDLPPGMEDMFFDKDGMLKQKYIDTGLYPEYERIQENEEYLEAKYIAEEERLEQLEASKKGVPQIESGNEASEEATAMYFCDEDMRWKTGYQEKKSTVHTASGLNNPASEQKESKEEQEDVEWFFDSDTTKWSTRPKQTSTVVNNAAVGVPETLHEPMDKVHKEEKEEEWYFDNDSMRWKTRDRLTEEKEPNIVEAKLTEFEARALEEARQMPSQDQEMIGDDDDDDSTLMDEIGGELSVGSDGTFSDSQEEEGFQMFFSQLQQEVKESGEEMSVDLSEGRELYVMMKNEFAEDDLQQVSIAEARTTQQDQERGDALPTIARGRSASKKEFGEIMNELKEEWGDDGLDIDVGDWSDDEMDPDDEMSTGMMSARQSNATEEQMAPAEAQGMVQTRVMERVREVDEGFDEHQEGAFAPQTVESFLQQSEQDSLPGTLDEDYELEDLKQLLPGMPLSRLRKVRQVYMDNLSDPSLLSLVLVLRERMPDWYTSNSIRKANVRSADFVMEKAQKEGLVDIHLLNGMLQVLTSAGSLDRALDVYDQFEQHKVKPTVYTNRLVVQMFLKQKRLSRCLAFKQKVEGGGQKLDLLSYGSLIAHCSKHKQLGSALMMLKECIEVNGAAPGESYLKQLRILCRHEGLVEEVGLEDMIGEDPIAWLRHGEAVLKREKSKRGNRDTNFINNLMVRG